MLKFHPPEDLDPNLVLNFFWLYSGVESGLKRNKYLKEDDDGWILADWTRFRREISSSLSQQRNDEVKKAISFLNEKPPKRQAFVGNEFKWLSQERREHEGKAAFALRMVTAIRNNLFHGEKWPGSPQEEVERNAQLLRAGIEILTACISIKGQSFFHLPHVA